MACKQATTSLGSPLKDSKDCMFRSQRPRVGRTLAPSTPSSVDLKAFKGTKRKALTAPIRHPSQGPLQHVPTGEHRRSHCSDTSPKEPSVQALGATGDGGLAATAGGRPPDHAASGEPPSRGGRFWVEAIGR